MAYWNFAHATPELYQLMYGMEGAHATSAAAREYAQPIVKYVTDELMRFNPQYIGRYIGDRSRLTEVLTTGVLAILNRR